MNAVDANMIELGERWKQALGWYLGSAALLKQVDALTDDFFARHPALERTPKAEGFIAGLALDYLSNEALSTADSQSAATQTQQTKVA